MFILFSNDSRKNIIETAERVYVEIVFQSVGCCYTMVHESKELYSVSLNYDGVSDQVKVTREVLNKTMMVSRNFDFIVKEAIEYAARNKIPYVGVLE